MATFFKSFQPDSPLLPLILRIIQTDFIQCPACWESFEIVVPPLSERPCEFDYDCEVCCRPFQICCEENGETRALSLGE